MVQIKPEGNQNAVGAVSCFISHMVQIKPYCQRALMIRSKTFIYNYFSRFYFEYEYP